MNATNGNKIFTLVRQQRGAFTAFVLRGRRRTEIVKFTSALTRHAIFSAMRRVTTASSFFFQVKGFQLEYLVKVPEVKDTVHKHSLLHHLCHMVMEKFPDSTDLYSEVRAGRHCRRSRGNFTLRRGRVRANRVDVCSRLSATFPRDVIANSIPSDLSSACGPY